MPATLRAVVTLPYTSGLPEDVVTNTFHFTTQTVPPSGGELTTLMDQLEGFYNTSTGVAGDQISGFLGDLVSRAAAACTIEIFNLADAEPRIAIAARQWTLGAADAATNTAPEVALCLSFQAPLQSGIPQARRRGRVYIGPFIQSVVGATGRPGSNLINSLVAAGNGMLDALQVAGGPRWVVYSRLNNAAYEITNGWVDNEFDTMRSRGRKPTTRTTFLA